MQTALPEPWRAALPDSSAPFCAELFPCTIFLRLCREQQEGSTA